MFSTRQMNDSKSNKTSFIEKIESELLSTLVNYAAPFISKKIKAAKRQNQKAVNLEDIVDSKPKIGFKDVKELEALLMKNLRGGIKADKNVKIGSNNVLYSFGLIKQKGNNDKSGNYSISMKYEENESGDRLKLSIKTDEKEIYSAEIENKKGLKDKVVPYSITLYYESNYAEERLSITYKRQIKNYLQQHIESKQDTSNMVPLKWLNILPETMMGGVLGFTYLGENFMGRRADLTGKTARMVDIHESIHTPDEYETRVLTSWIMEKVKGRYIK